MASSLDTFIWKQESGSVAECLSAGETPSPPSYGREPPGGQHPRKEEPLVQDHQDNHREKRRKGRKVLVKAKGEITKSEQTEWFLFVSLPISSVGEVWAP